MRCFQNLCCNEFGSPAYLFQARVDKLYFGIQFNYINAIFLGETLGETGKDLLLPVGSNYGELVAEITSNDAMYPAVLRVGRKTIFTSSASSTAGVNLTSPSQAGMLKFTRHLTSSHAGGAFFNSGGASNAYFNSVLWAHDGNGYAPLVENGGSSNYLYGNYSVELRPYVYFGQDLTRNITAVDATERVLYSVGPIDLDANQVVEVRYVGVFGAPASIIPFRSKIIKGTSATATTGVTVQSQLYRKYGPEYVYNNAFHSTAERPATAQTGQYYNVVVSLPSGGSLPVIDWGELEVVKR
ncbi:hypothetical protein [Pedobacter heparinus]|uniref:hypothetical protein n=1 Tax=Pedobacter heparinus TaxID=984 RepID=UPI0029313635|nr:hypothetical protein [Pedobacter heparinus]